MAKHKLVIERNPYGFKEAVIEFEDLMVITGLNGTGKSRFLREIARGTIYANPEGGRSRPLFTQTSLTPFPASQVGSTAQSNTDLAAQKSAYLDFLDALKELDPATPDDDIFKHKKFSLNAYGIDIFGKIAKRLGKGLRELTEFDFEIAKPPAVHQSFTEKFWIDVKHYADLQSLQLLQRARDSVEGTNLALTHEEFVRLFGEAPWQRLNERLVRIGVPYLLEVTGRKPDDLYRPLTFRFVRRQRDAAVDQASMSAGETTMLWLSIVALKLDVGQGSADILLLDEIDSALHPSLIGELMQTIKEVFVCEMNLPVILVTHSPTTVVLAPEQSLFVMKEAEGNVCELVQKSKQDALRLLNTGLPLLSVSLDNRRIVFTESDVDSRFYEETYLRVRDDLQSTYSLSFVATGTRGQSNCANTIRLVDEFRSKGSKNVFGAIDWDLKNSSTEFVKVSGGGEAYSLENIIFDPIAMAILLLDKRRVSSQEMGLGQHIYSKDLHVIRHEALQKVADYILERWVDKGHFTEKGADCIERRYWNGRAVMLPIWFLHSQGHQIEKYIPNALHLQSSGENHFKTEVVQGVYNPYPGWIPQTVISLFHELLA